MLACIVDLGLQGSDQLALKAQSSDGNPVHELELDNENGDLMTLLNVHPSNL